MISRKRAKKMKKRALEVGYDQAALDFGVQVESLKRSIRSLKGKKGELLDAVKESDAKLERVKYEWQWEHPPKPEGPLNCHCSDNNAPCNVERLASDYIKDVDPSFREANPDGHRILVIGDIHAPFDHAPYFDHCVSVYNKYECDKVVFTGDIIDNHFSSYHETDADGLGGQDELDLAIDRLRRWYAQFPNADVIIGNHDRMVMRKAQSSSIPTRWIKEYKEVLETPRWNFTPRVVYDNVQYIHGEGGMAHTRMVKDLMSTVQGHLHTRAYVQWHVGNGYKIFGMQVGCGIDQDSYAMGYAKDCPKPAIACGVVLAGKVAVSEVM